MALPADELSHTHQLNICIHVTHGPPVSGRRAIGMAPEWVTDLQAKGVTPVTVKRLRFVLSAIFTTALGDVIFLHPCKGVKTPTVARKPLKIITPQQFDMIYEALLDPVSRLLIETDIESGLRWGELTELRVRDLDPATRMLTVSRAVVQVNPKFHPDGVRFLVKPYPKDKEYRRFKLSQQLVDKLVAHIGARQLRDDDLLFTITRQDAPPSPPRVLPDSAALGLTAPNAAGRCYRHGSLSGYAAGRCRCEHCRAAYAIYRARRRDADKDRARQMRTVDTDGHIPRDWFRLNVWRPALAKAGMTFHVRGHDLRHAHASWLLAGGADLQVVRDRLGHSSISTTEKYLHTLPDADDTALDAFAKIRNRAREQSA
jgi:integrase